MGIRRDDFLYTEPPFKRFIIKNISLSWLLIFLLLVLGSVGVLMMYSAAGGHMQPWAKTHLFRLSLGVCVLYAVAMINIQYLYKGAIFVYIAGIVLLLMVPFIGKTGMGAQRWIDLGIMNVQPSELMKLAVVILLARLYENNQLAHNLKFAQLVFYLILLAIPSGLVFTQPDLGTAIIIFAIGMVLLFLMGFQLRYFFALGILGTVAVPFIGIKSYQLNRILNFLNPEHDPLGSGYQIIQSKIAFGSGGLDGKGFLKGTQNYLQFLPEKHTDFVLAMFGEEFGFYGIGLLVFLILMIVVYAGILTAYVQHAFGRMICIGVTLNFFLYFVINSFMVMGMLPVVGVPFPLLSYGGTTIITVMAGFGLLLNMVVHKDYPLKKLSTQADLKQIF